MSAPAYVSSVTVEPARVSEASVWTSPDGPGADMTSEANIEISALAPEGRTEDGAQRFVAGIGVTVQLVDSSGPRAPRARAYVKLIASVTVPATWDDPIHAAKVAAAATLYPQCQAYLSMLAAMSQVGAFPTPGIDPEALVSAVDAMGEAGE